MSTAEPGVGLRRRAARGTIVNAAFFAGLHSLAFLKGLLVAAFLTTGEYGVWGILAITLAAVLILKQAGIGDKYVQQEAEDQEAAFQKAFTLELLVSAVFLAVLLASLPLLALVTGRTELVAPGVAVAMVLPAYALASPVWIFYRRMQFVRQRSLQAVDPLVGFLVTVVLALAGAGYWSLVAGALTGAWAGAVVALVACPYRLALRYDRGTLGEYAGFSWPLLVAGGASVVIAQCSVLIGESELGLAGAGAIALAATIAQYADRIDQIVTETIYPAICAVRDRSDLLFETFVKSNRLALMWGVPFGVGLALFASDLVAFGIGEQWRPAVVLLQAFGLTAAAGHLGFNWSAFYRARGETRPLAVVSVITAVAFLAIAVPLLLSHGLEGFAWGVGAMTAVGLAGRTFYLVRLFPAFGMLRHAARAIAPTVPATLAVAGARALEAGPRSAASALGELALYLTVTAAATLVLERTLLREVAGYLRSAQAAPPAVAA